MPGVGGAVEWPAPVRRAEDDAGHPIEPSAAARPDLIADNLVGERCRVHRARQQAGRDEGREEPTHHPAEEGAGVGRPFFIRRCR